MLMHFFRPLLIGLVVGGCAVLAVLLALSAIATVYDIPAAIILPLATFANAFGAFFGGFTSAKINKRNGWLFGLLSSVCLFLFSTMAGLALFSDTNGTFLLIKAFIMLACGMVGGILAVNLGKRHSR